jgi:hypothetical protein
MVGSILLQTAREMHAINGDKSILNVGRLDVNGLVWDPFGTP